jgi:hypothetical protein
MYDRFSDAQKVVHDLEAFGVPSSDISMVSNADRSGDVTGDVPDDRTNRSGAGGAAGAVAGTAIGGGLGLAAGLGALAIPGVGPVVAAGWLIATLAGAGVGAAAGGLVGGLTGAGISKEEADVYAEGVRGGGTLVTVRATDSEAPRIEEIMGRHSPVDWRQRRASYGDSWTGFDETRTVAVDPVDDVRPRGVLDERVTGVPQPGADGAFAPGTNPGRRL